MSSPYDMVEARVLTGNGKMTTLMRPYLFDSEPVNMDTLKNHFGYVIRPTKLTASCPNCGNLLDVDVTTDLTYKCLECYKEPKRKIINPFVVDPLSDIWHLIYSEKEEVEEGSLEHLLDHLIESEEIESDAEEDISPFCDDGLDEVKHLVVTNE